MIDAELLAVVETGCRECMTAWPALFKFADSDNSASRYGASNPRIAVLVGPGTSTGTTLRRLKRLQAEGKVLRYPGGDARGGATLWWPVGMWEKVR